MDCKADKIRLWIHLEGAWMFQIDFMISKRLDVRKVNWRGVKASGSISARIWEQVGSNHALPPLSRVHTSIAHHCVLNCNYLVQLHIHMKSWYFNLLQWIDIPESVHISGADTSLARQLAKSCKLSSTRAWLHCSLTHMHALLQEGGCLHICMHAKLIYAMQTTTARYRIVHQYYPPALPLNISFCPHFSLEQPSIYLLLVHGGITKPNWRQNNRLYEFELHLFSWAEADRCQDHFWCWQNHPFLSPSAADCRPNFFASLTGGWPSAWPVKINVIGNQ